MRRRIGKQAQHPNLSTPEREDLKPGRKVWSVAETAAQRNTIENLLTQGASVRACVAVMRQQHGVGAKRTKTLLAAVRQQWAQEDEANRASNKSAAIRRITKGIQLAQGVKDPKTGLYNVKPDFAAWRGFEAILADIQGTREPLKIDVDVQVSQAVLHVIGSMSPEQVATNLAKYREMKRAAEAYKLLPMKSANGSAKSA